MSEKSKPRELHVSIGAPFEEALTETLRVANQWLERLLGEAATELGGLLGDRVKNWRMRQAVSLVAASLRRVESRGIREPRQVPPSVLIPLLEAASLETDAELQEWWVELLTTAADPGEGPVPSVFPRILAELSATEARVLAWLHRKGFHSDSLERFHAVARFEEVQQQFPEIHSLDFKVIVTNLCRLGLSEPGLYVITRSGGSRAISRYDTLSLTPLAAEFVEACQSPSVDVGDPSK